MKFGNLLSACCQEIIDDLFKEIDDNIDPDTGLHCDNWVVDMQNDVIGKCMEIVKTKFKEYQEKFGND